MQKHVIIDNYAKGIDQASKTFNKEYPNQKFGKNYDTSVKNKSAMVSLFVLHQCQ